MRRTFSIHQGRNTIFVTDNTWGYKTPMLASPGYKSWNDANDAKAYFAKLGATAEALNVCGVEFEETGDATLPVDIP
jgi:hypothetical protein